MTIFSKPLGPRKQLRGPLLVALALLLLSRSRLGALNLSKFGPLLNDKATPQELQQARKQLYFDEDNGSKTLLLPHRGRVARVPITPISPEIFKRDANSFKPIPKSHKPNVDRLFLKQLLAILRIVFPSLTSKEVGILLLHTFFLVTRTILSVYVAHLDGRLVRDIVSADGKGFLRGLGWWFALAIPSSYTNSMLRHLQSKLSLRLRTRLTRYTHDLYLSSAPDLKYYRVSGEGGLEGIDQYITSDISAFCESLSTLYGNVMKPSLDILIFTTQLTRKLGAIGSVLLTLNYMTTATILRAVTPAFGRLAAVEARLEGEYRAGVGRIGRESEEIAFYGGGGRENHILMGAYLRLVKHVNSIYKIRVAYEWTEDYVIKYLWSAAGYCLISIPVWMATKRTVGVQAPPTSSSGKVDDVVADRTENYISSRRLLISLADAGGRLMYAYKDILELAGLTTRIYTMLSTLHHLQPLPEFERHPERIEFQDAVIGIPKKDPRLGETALVGNADEGFDFADSSESNASHSERPLVRDLNIRVERGEHLMISGPNGVGKTAVARVLAGLWAIEDGKVIRPNRGFSGVFVVPQRAYMVTGSLLDQIIYPHSYADFKKSGRSEQDLIDILKVVHLAYLPAREGGWDTIKEWKDVLSGGEKQRVSLSFYPFFLSFLLPLLFEFSIFAPTRPPLSNPALPTRAGSLAVCSHSTNRWEWPGCFTTSRLSRCWMVRAFRPIYTDPSC
ncbi:hypothetical protein FRC16_009759 [Serendipita sp. 398]|nr:hypothetical protein FRC16_009759 [Serendipita sp. 398]